MVRYVCCSHFTATTMLWWVCVPLQSPVSFIRMIYYFSILFKACCVLDIVKVVFQSTSGISVTLGGNLVKCVSPSGGAYTRATVTLFPFAVAYLPSWSSSSSIFSTLTLLDIRVVAPPLLLFLCELKMEFVYPNLFDMFHVEISPVSCLFHKERILIVHRLYSCCWCRFSLLMNWSGCDIACCIAMVAKMPTVELSEALTEWRSNQNCAAWGWLHVRCCIHGLVLSVDSYSCVGCFENVPSSSSPTPKSQVLSLLDQLVLNTVSAPLSSTVAPSFPHLWPLSLILLSFLQLFCPVCCPFLGVEN